MTQYLMRKYFPIDLAKRSTNLSLFIFQIRFSCIYTNYINIEQQLYICTTCNMRNFYDNFRKLHTTTYMLYTSTGVIEYSIGSISVNRRPSASIGVNRPHSYFMDLGVRPQAELQSGKDDGSVSQVLLLLECGQLVIFIIFSEQ